MFIKAPLTKTPLFGSLTMWTVRPSRVTFDWSAMLLRRSRANRTGYGLVVAALSSAVLWGLIGAAIL